MKEVVTEIKFEAIDGVQFSKKEECEYYETLTPTQRAAIYLHERECHWNHTDGCGWYYEVNKGIHDWAGSTHLDYLEKVLNAEHEYKKFFRILFPSQDSITLKY